MAKKSLAREVREQAGKVANWGIYTLCVAALPIWGAMIWSLIKKGKVPDWATLFGKNGDLLLITAALTADAIGRFFQTMKKLPAIITASNESEKIQKIQEGQGWSIRCISVCIINLIAATLFYAAIATSLEQNRDTVERTEKKISEKADQWNQSDLKSLIDAVREQPVKNPTAIAGCACGMFLVSVGFSISAILAERE